MLGNAHVQRSAATVSVGNVVAGTTGVTVSISNSNAKYNSASPLLSDRVICNPQEALPDGLGIGWAAVTATGTIKVKILNMSSANVDGGSAVGLNIDLLKATGSI